MSGRISVVIPTFERCGSLRAALDSVLAQTLLPHEIVVVDDGSRDGTAEMLAGLARESSVPVIVVRQANRGPAAARNVGVMRATGDYIAFLDDDDRWLPDKLARQMACLDAHPALALLGCAADTLRYPARRELVPLTIRHLLLRNWLLTPTVVVRREALLVTGGFPEDMRCCEDYALWLRVADHYPCALLNVPLVLCGGGKPSFGAAGLSADLEALRAGEREALRRWAAQRPGRGLTSRVAYALAALRHYRRQRIVARRGK